MSQLDLQPIADQSIPQQSQVSTPISTPAAPVSQASVPVQPQQNTGNPGKLDLQPMLDLQPLGDSNNDQSKITPFEQGMTKQLYNNVPFGKDIIKGTDAIAGTHMASDIENNEPPNTLGEKAGEFVGGSLSLFPAWEAGGALLGPGKALLGGSLGVGAQSGVEAKTAGKSTPEAVGDAALTAGGTFLGGKAIEGIGNAVAPLLRGVAGHGDVYRNLLNPGKGVVNDIEVKSGKDINDAFQTMADERLPIKSVVQNNRDTIDTNEARAQVKGKISGLYDQLQQKLAGSDAQFNLEDLRQQTLDKLRPVFKNDEDYESAQKEVNSQFDAAIRQRTGMDPDAIRAGDAEGDTDNDPVVDASILSNMKEGMWQKGYNLLAPNSQKVSRIIGNTLKQAIEDAHPEDTDIKDLNQQMGNLQTVDGILQKTHGKVVNGGALGNYLSKGTGAIVGEQIGALLGHPFIGTGVGGFVGEQANKLLNNPELITSTLAKIRDLHDFGGNVADHVSDLYNKFGSDNVNSPKDAINEALTPEVMDGKSIGYSPKVGLNRAIPSPQDAGQSSGPVINQGGNVPKGLPEPLSDTARTGVNVPAGKGLPSPQEAGTSDASIIKPEAQPGQVAQPPKLLGKPDTVYGDGFTMRNYKPQPVQLSDSDRQDLADMLDWTHHQQNGERYSFMNAEGQREYSGTPSGHAQSVQEVGPQESIHIMQKALLNKPLSPMQTLKVNKYIKDFQTNIKPKMNASVPAEGDVEGNTGSPEENKPFGPDLGSNKGSAFIGGKDAPTFYSQAAKTIDEKMSNAATPDQIRGILSPSNGVKPDELKWMGLDDFLAGKTKISKADLQQFMKENQVNVQEVQKTPAVSDAKTKDLNDRYEHAQETRARIGNTLGSDPYMSGQPPRWMYKDANGKPTDVPEKHIPALDLASEAERDYDDHVNADERDHPEGTTKFDQYQTPGGKNYKEMLLTLPQKSGGIKGPNGWGDTAGGTSDSANFKSQHFDEPNILAHVRMNDRIDAEGKKVLHIEEVQSDWHQKGKKLGYREASNLSPRQMSARIQELENKGINATSPEKQEWAKLKSIQENKGVPDAPFQKTWHELAMKRMLRYASENGYDKLSWTTGAQQSERYDLSKQIDRITWRKQDDGNYYVAAHPKSANESAIPITKTLAPKDISDFVGKDAAEQILKADYGTLRGQQLSIGGEGMKGFYDKILPDFMNKYTKKWGGSVGETKIGTDNLGKQIPDGAGGLVRQGTGVPKYEKVHSVDITPAMKKSVMKQGQPLFNWNPTTVTGAGGLGLGAAIGAKNAKADTLRPIGVPSKEDQDRMSLPGNQYTKMEEGFSVRKNGKIDKDTRGHNTVGYGFNIDDPAIRSMIPADVLNGKRDLTRPEADSIFPRAYSRAQSDAVRFIGTKSWGNLSQGQKKALTDVSYDLGFHKLSGFKKMQAAFQGGDWKQASYELLHDKNGQKSPYAQEVPNRARRNSLLITNA